MINDKSHLYQMADKILNRFNFEYVQAYMIINQWHHGTTLSVEELKKMASRQLEFAITSTHPSTECSCGGFHVVKLKNTYLSLNFVIEDEWEGSLSRE